MFSYESAMDDFTSICIPAYNNPDDVDRLLHSISVQTFRNFEVIVSDDSNAPGSPVAAISEQWNAEGSLLAGKLFYYHNDSPLGTVYNWNAALRHAKGTFIKIMFSDDWFTGEDSLSAFVSMLKEHPDCSLAFSGSRQVVLHPEHSDSLTHLADESASVKDRHASASFIEALRADWRHLFISNEIGAPSAVIYRRILPGQKARENSLPMLFDERSGFASDVFLYMDILKEHADFTYTEAPLTSIGLHENQYTETFSKRDARVYNDYRYMYEKYALSEIPEYRQYMLREYLISYKKSCAEAGECGISAGDYYAAKFDDFRRSVTSFIDHKTGRA